MLLGKGKGQRVKLWSTKTFSFLPSVNKAVLWHVSFCIQVELNPENVLASKVGWVEADHAGHRGGALVVGRDVGGGGEREAESQSDQDSHFFCFAQTVSFLVVTLLGDLLSLHPTSTSVNL